MSKYTPGPWSDQSRSAVAPFEFIVWSDADRCPVALIGSGMDGAPPRSGVRAANARLIACAPELLEALILLVRTHEEPAETLLQEAREQRWLEQAQAIIKKATGT